MNRRNFLKALIGISFLFFASPNLLASSAGFTLSERNRWTHIIEKDQFSFLAIGDMGTGWKTQYEIIEQMENHLNPGTDSVLLLGDIVYPYPTTEQDFKEKFEKPFKPLIDKELRFYPAWGNHDWHTEEAKLLKDYFVAPNYYTFVNGPAQFWAVNSNKFDSNQIKWLKESLSISKSPWKIVFLHHSPYSSGKGHHNNQHLIKNLTPILNEFNVDLCLSGHNHLYERSEKIGSTIYITSGGGSASLHKYDDKANFPRVKANSIHHFLLIEGNNKKLNLKAIDKIGNTIDSMNLEKNF
ncbi:MAG: metallophosphoesterase [Candidatus Caenarcaniphilales bacterium]|nr:metallophosphoesterase [Candidatus Caenarcaniphilales bacterium]